MEYKITLTEAQDKALRCVALDPQEWIENAVYERCRLAMDEIVHMEVEKALSVGSSISGTKDDVVINSTIKTLKEIEDEQLQSQQNEGVE